VLKYLLISEFSSFNVSSAPTSPISAGPDAQFGSNTTIPVTNACVLTGRNITTTSGSTCAQIASQYNVSDNDVLVSNPILDVGCAIAADTQLCIPQACQTYTIAINDTCDSVAQLAGSRTGVNITTVQLQSFNPELGTYCQLMALRVGQKICLTPNGGFPTVGATTNANPSATPTATAPIPTPTAPGTTSDCGKYYQVQPGDVCNTVILNNTISLPDFVIMNPGK
jgi:LysM repeat protein